MSIKSFLRYNGRHNLYFPGDWALPQLNPIMSYSHTKAGKRTKTLHEPYRLYLLRRRWFARGGVADCNGAKGTWNYGPDGYRTCSYCGSIHYEDLLDICRKALTHERYGVSGTDKGYKFYVQQPKVRNAGEGAIKFYTNHRPMPTTLAQRELFMEALRISQERWNARYQLSRRTP